MHQIEQVNIVFFTEKMKNNLPVPEIRSIHWRMFFSRTEGFRIKSILLHSKPHKKL